MNVDVIIIGGGLVGLAAARALTHQNFSVCVIDQQPCVVSPVSESYELRVSAIASPSVHLFKQLGVWEAIIQQRVGEFTTIKIWEEENPEAIQLEPAHGYIIENNVMQNALLDKPEFKIFAPAKIQHIQKNAKNIEVELENNQKILGKLLVGADGGNSKIREWAKLGVSEKAYDQSALVATVHSERPHHNIARQRFLAEGPLAFLPLSDSHHCSIVWTNALEAAEKLLKTTEENFNAELNKYFGDELGEIRLVSQRLAFPLIKKHAQNYVAERIALIGDAAHTIHPLAGQGVNLGFSDVHALCEVLVKAKQEKRDMGLLHTLRRYERARKSDNLIMQNLMDVFNSARIRKWGVSVVSRSEWAKKMMLLWMKFREKQLCKKLN